MHTVCPYPPADTNALEAFDSLSGPDGQQEQLDRFCGLEASGRTFPLPSIPSEPTPRKTGSELAHTGGESLKFSTFSS